MIIDEPAAGRIDDGEIVDLLSLQRSGVFDGGWFLDRNTDLAGSDTNALVHYHRFGWREGRWPNAYFDPKWYLENNRDVRDRDMNPLLHYVEYGEKEGRRPIAHFDPDWYREAFAVPADMLCLAHFLARRHGGTVSPIPEFDASHYSSRYPDIVAAGIDPFEHYVLQGAAENREPSTGFDPLYYRARYLHSLPDANPVLHYRAHRHLPGVLPARDVNEVCIPSEVRRNTRAGPLFEDPAPLPAETGRRAMVLAYYLPQFHPVPENDAWWGTGFTEWTNVARAVPRFAGHYQPRIPRDLGHYRLDGSAVLKRQAALARSAGLHGFVFYFYWFDGRRLLESPLEALLADPTIDLPFCLMWANENWTRRWDGSEDDVLLAQTYRRSDEAALVATFLRHFADARYIRLQGRPVLMVYRAGLIPAGAVARWRQLFRAAGEDPMFIMAQSFDDRDPTAMGMDAAVEFPPHKITTGLEPINKRLHWLDHGASARVYDYDDVAASTDLSPQPYPLIRTAMPGWDNDPRRQGAGMVVHGATPAGYEAWLGRLIDAAREQPVGGEAIVCINAWNEWGEGAYLEPDVHFGSAFLNATARAVAERAVQPRRSRLLLVGHDAFPAGAQMLLLNIGRTLIDVQGVDVSFLLLGDGPMLPAFRALAPTTVAAGANDLVRQTRAFAAAGPGTAIVNSAAAAAAVQPLADAGVDVTLLVHELPRLLRERNLVGVVRTAVEVARQTIFAAAHVRDRVTELVPLCPTRTIVLPQGLYRPVTATDREERRNRLRVPPNGLLAIGLGYADLRKGFDLFMQAWRIAHARDPSIHMLWVGDIDPTVHAYLGPEMAAAEATGTFHHVGFDPNGADWLVAADVFLLTSREDPLPTAVIEAMSVGVPTIAFEESGGIPDMLKEWNAGRSVPLGDVVAMVRQMRFVGRSRAMGGAALAHRARAAFDFGTYARQVFHLAHPGCLDVTVVVPSYNYARYLPDRLASIFAQTHPVAEIVVLDDASTDASEAAVREAAAAARRTVRWVGSDRNSGSVFRQWRRAAELAQTEWLWIAEADDAAEPGFLAALAHAAHAEPDTVLAFTDSRAIDAEGRTLWPDHQEYYRRAGATLLARTGIYPAETVLRECLAGQNLLLNASAVLWRRSALLAAFDRCGADLDGLRVAGDWRLYAEVLSAGGTVAYVDRPLNLHRRHGSSVTHRLARDRHLREVASMQRHMRSILGSRPDLVRAQHRALQATRQALAGTAMAAQS